MFDINDAIVILEELKHVLSYELVTVDTTPAIVYDSVHYCMQKQSRYSNTNWFRTDDDRYLVKALKYGYICINVAITRFELNRQAPTETPID